MQISINKTDNKNVRKLALVQKSKDIWQLLTAEQQLTAYYLGKYGYSLNKIDENNTAILKVENRIAIISTDGEAILSSHPNNN